MLSRFRPTLLTAITLLAVLTACVGSAANSSSPAALPTTEALAPSADASAEGARPGSLLLIGRIVTVDAPAEAEALLIEDGVVTAIGARDEVLALAGDEVAVIDLGTNVAYPGFIDAHAHWIGDRAHYGLETPADAMNAALSRGWTSISEQWVNDERLAELEALAADDALPMRVDAYLTLNEPAPGSTHFGDWYADREPGHVSDFLRVQGLKMHLDNGWGTIFHWEPGDLSATVGRANDKGWQVSIHTVSTEAHDMVLDAFEAAIGPAGPNPLHHRIDHAVQVTDRQLDRMVAMNLPAVVHLDGAAADWVLEADYLGNLGPDNPGEQVGWLARWRDYVDAGLHVAASTDTPWVYPDFALTDSVGRPVDQIAGGMDGRGLSNPETPDWVLRQLLTADQGLRAVTVDAAYALGDEARRGHLAPGTLGDVTILSGDVLAATPEQIRDTSVVATIVGGVIAYCGSVEFCSRP